MGFPRRFLPSTGVLAAFEAAARHQSFTAAAAELNLTQSAVSRQIRSLEETLGSELFHRAKQSVRLTLAGESYAREIREALQRIATATLGFRANPRGGSLSLAILPTFGTRWLAPRLPLFIAANPGVTVNLSTRLEPGLEGLDAAIHFGHADQPGVAFEVLMGEAVIPACSPALLAEHGFTRPEDLLEAPLIHLASRPDAWERWFGAMNVQFGSVHGMLLDQFAVAAQAAAAGLGVALLPTFLITGELQRGELVAALDRPVPSAENYYLAWSPERAEYPPLVAFRDWIGAEARAFVATQSLEASPP